MSSADYAVYWVYYLRESQREVLCVLREIWFFGNLMKVCFLRGLSLRIFIRLNR